jgi:hypothetical protein
VPWSFSRARGRGLRCGRRPARIPGEIRGSAAHLGRSVSGKARAAKSTNDAMVPYTFPLLAGIFASHGASNACSQELQVYGSLKGKEGGLQKLHPKAGTIWSRYRRPLRFIPGDS